MAQLIKLQDYISRYEADIYRYPGQYIRLKQSNWNKVKKLWSNQRGIESPKNDWDTNEAKYSRSKWFKRSQEETINQIKKINLPNREDDLKQYFLNRLMPFQLKWASSTIREASFLNRDFEYDETLKYFLQRFPDTFLIMYKPIFKLKEAPVEGEIIMITPLSIICVTLLELDSTIDVIAGDDRTWYKEENNIQTRILSPLISLTRTERIVRSILKAYDIDFPIKKVVLSRGNSIQFVSEPFNTALIGREQYDEWFSQLRKLKSPLKHLQLKACDKLLSHCQTTSVKRPEWEQDDGFMSVDQFDQ